MKVKFRTVLLVFLFIKLCILFTVLQESIESIKSGDHPWLFGTNDIYLFDVMLTIICSISIAASLLIILFFAIGHNRFRKPYVVVAFAVNLIIVAPFFYSGIALCANHSNDLHISPSLNRSFSGIRVLAEKYLSVNQGRNGTMKVFRNVNEKVISHFDQVEHVQKRYCCCGLTGSEFYGFHNKTTALLQSVPLTSKLHIRCPRTSLFKNSTCTESHLHGCEQRLQEVHPRRILIYSCIGAIFSTLFLVVSPMIYSQFELDRRCARVTFIREWRRTMELRIREHRLKHLRNAQLLSTVSAKGSSSSNAPQTTLKTDKTQKNDKTERNPNRSSKKF